ncbi:hypothetical protein C8Q79DRAFT_1011498 [Trametes meyenii]|nr:hypothetical protein C8Q79DRAFT_1011498 [Trametes meyenii]
MTSLGYLSDLLTATRSHWLFGPSVAQKHSPSYWTPGPDAATLGSWIMRDPAGSDDNLRSSDVHAPRSYSHSDAEWNAVPIKDAMDVEATEFLEQVALGGAPSKPLRYDWSSPPSTPYNHCVIDAFCVDFWDCADAGEYDVKEIPPHYQKRQYFVAAVRRHLNHRRRKWLKIHRAPLSAAQEQAVAKHYARNSRIRTTFMNRRDAASYIPDPELAAHGVCYERQSTWWAAALFADLRALHAVIGAAIDKTERKYKAQSPLLERRVPVARHAVLRQPDAYAQRRSRAEALKLTDLVFTSLA